MLRTGDVRAIAAAQRPGWVRFVPGLVLLVAVAVVAGLHARFDVVPLCTDVEPCGPAPFDAVTTGLALAVPFAAFASVRTAAGLAGAFLATAVVGQLGVPVDQEQAVWLWTLDGGYVALAVLLAAAVAGLRHGRVEAAWAAGVPRRRPPGVPQRIRRHGGWWRLAAVVMFMAAAGIAGAALVAQAHGQAQQASARRVAGEVIGHPDEFTVQVRLATGDVARIGVADALAHPVGARRGVLVDDRGLRQLVGEPYDATGWLVLAVMAAGAGLALLALARVPGAALRALLTHEQPAVRAFVRYGPGRLAIYAADARPGEPPLLEYDTDDIEYPDGITTSAAAVPEPRDEEPHEEYDEGQDEDEDAVGMMVARSAVLYGVPAAGRWCAAEVDGRVLVPLGPARVPFKAPAFTTPPADGAQFELITLDDAAVQPIIGVPDPVTLPPRPEEVAALRPEDRDSDPDLVRTHRRGPAVGYAFALALPLILWGTARWLPRWPYPGWVLLTAPFVVLGCAGAWRMYLRPRLAWNGAGVSAVGVTGAQLLAWNNVAAVRLDGDGTVRVETPHRGFVVTAHGGGPAGRLFGQVLGRGERSGPQLAAALRLAKHRAEERARAGERDITSLPPAPVEPRPPASLWIFGLLELLVYAYLLSPR